MSSVCAGQRGCNREIERSRKADCRLPEKFPARRQTLRIAVNDLAIVVYPTDDPETERHQQHHPDVPIGQISPQHSGHGNRDQDQRASHGRCAGFRQMGFGPVVANRLTNLVGRQLANHDRADDERDQERRKSRQHRAQCDVVENVEGADVKIVGQPLREREQHQVIPFMADFPFAAPIASTTRSMRMKREPLTSTVQPFSS